LGVLSYIFSLFWFVYQRKQEKNRESQSIFITL